jgi:hypothetical protein
MSRHELDPLIHVHRPEERMIERDLAQGETRRIRSARRECVEWLLSSVAHPLATSTVPVGRAGSGACRLFTRSPMRCSTASGSGCARMRLGDSPARAASSALTMRPPKMRSDEGQMFEDFRGADQRSGAGRCRCMSGGIASMAPRSGRAICPAGIELPSGECASAKDSRLDTEHRAL